MFIERIRIHAELPEQWPFSMAPVRQIKSQDLVFKAPVTFLVGENGSGKSTILEAIAEACKIHPEGGSGATRYAAQGMGDPSALAGVLKIDYTLAGNRMMIGPRRKRRASFLRAETLLAVARRTGGALRGFVEADLDTLSHGEGFQHVLSQMFVGPGLFLMDEPEAALSFLSCLTLVEMMDEMARGGAQIICATHSPLLTALPGAEIIEIGDHGIRSVAWSELEIVDHWRRYLDRPESYLRHFLGER